MSQIDYDDLSFDEEDEIKFPRPTRHEFDEVVARAMSRRSFISGALVFGSGASAFGAGAFSGTPADAQQARRFGFQQLAPQTDDTVHVPQGYRWDVLVRWGDPLFSDAPEFDPHLGCPTLGSDRVFGENTDGMELFVVGASEVLVVNSEFVNRRINLPADQNGKPVSADDIMRLQNFHGVTVMEIVEGDDGWHVVIDSPFNRRIHHRTPMRIDGPAAGHDLLKTHADPSGTQSLGTFNNCGSGRTPWGTYLTCEENFNGYFGTTTELSLDKVTADGFHRYGISTKIGAGRYNYHGFDARFDLSKEPNEPHRAGYVVEIDPADPTSTPIKRTALGRFKHENAAVTIAQDGRVVVYMGDDERGEYLYKWVSRDKFISGEDTSTLLSEGQLFTAKFDEDMTGHWVALTPESTGMSQAEIAIFTRIAATRVDATTMDRPEWVAVNPVSAEAYCCLTNNVRRGVQTDDGLVRSNSGGASMQVNGPNPRVANTYGQIVRWRPHNRDHAVQTFDWDLYVMAGNPEVHATGPKAGTANINAGNLFNSPDGMHIDLTGLIWIQTDGDDENQGDFQGMGNNQMLAGDPVTGEIKRFMTGPKGSEVTGLAWSADRRTMFVGIQHPGGSFPDGAGRLPRSSIVAIKRDDNAQIG